MAIDVAANRERDRRQRLRRLTIGLAPIAIWMWYRLMIGNPVTIGLPDFGPNAVLWLPMAIIVVLIAAVLILPMLGNSRSPHVIYLPEQIDIGFDDVKGLAAVVREVRHTLEVFLNHQRFREEMGGSPRRGMLFEGPPGTGKTHLAKAMAKEAGVPFLFVSATSFQSMWYGATARKIRSYFRQLRKVARREGGAIGFIEEIDAIATSRGGMNFSPNTTEHHGDDSGRSGGAKIEGMSSGLGGIVNELLIQMQSFDEPTRPQKAKNVIVRFVNRFLASDRQFKTASPDWSNILVIAATNRADSLDPALLRPGRFDRILHIDAPDKENRVELIEYFLGKKAHTEALDDPQEISKLAASTQGYTPAALERLFDEALLMALRDEREHLNVADLHKAKMEVEIGLANPTDYPEDERRSIATHEAGHATMAYLVGKGRRLEVLSIIKRRGSLGLLSHRDTEERYTRTESEMRSFIQISLGGMVAEEIFFGESGTGPAGDLAAATNLATEMVGSYGLGGSLISFRAADKGAFGGNLVASILSDSKARSTVDCILNDAKHEVQRQLSEHRYLVEALRDALLEHNELIEHEILDVLRVAEERALVDGNLVVDLRDPHGRLIEGPTAIELEPSPETG
ncbi:MAG: AAA family ATPase [Acidimicrobiia bacterium]|nr:AAA family ATPase [Acidimicrobiia bacterium]NNF64813.1 AAA family ATPase [Acidimicrobiia bacterium]